MDFNKTARRFDKWWKGELTGGPLIRIIAKKEPAELKSIAYDSPFEYHMDPVKKSANYMNYMENHDFLADSFPHLSFNIGPGSLATYLGSEPHFTMDTVWYEDVAGDGWEKAGDFIYREDNKRWQLHLDVLKRAVNLAAGNYLVDIPDLVENVDILSAMRGPQNLCYDLYDMPDKVKMYVEKIDDIYFEYYDRIYDIVKTPDNICSYTAFEIMGRGKCAKVQCDFCAMISPSHFREFVKPSLEKQCKLLDVSLFHLDGPDAVVHMDALMEIEALNALQFTPGEGYPDGGNPRWYPIHDKLKDAGKSIWITISDGIFDDWLKRADELVNRYGIKSLYLIFPVMNRREAEILMDRAETHWGYKI